MTVYSSYAFFPLFFYAPPGLFLDWGGFKKSRQKLFFKLFRKIAKINQKELKPLNYKEKYQSFYNSAEWKALRNYKWGQANGLCEYCLKKGIVRQAREIHHIVPIEEDWSKRLDYDNLVALCSDCHNEQHERISPLQKFLKDWENI